MPVTSRRSNITSAGQNAKISHVLTMKALVLRKLKVAYKALMNIVVDYSVTHPDLRLRSATTADEVDFVKRQNGAGLEDSSIPEFQILFASTKIQGLPDIIQYIEDSVCSGGSPRAAFNAMLGVARLSHVMYRVKRPPEYHNDTVNPLWSRRCNTPEVDEALLRLSIQLWEYERRTTDFRTAATILELSQKFRDRRFNGGHYLCLRALRFMHTAPRIAVSVMMSKWLLNHLPAELGVMVLDHLERENNTTFSEDQGTLTQLMKPLGLPPFQDCSDPRCMRELTARSRNCPNKMFLLVVKDTNDYLILHPSYASKTGQGRERWGGSSICPHRPCPWHHD